MEPMQGKKNKTILIIDDDMNIGDLEQEIAKSVMLDRISEEILDCTETSLKTHMSHLRSKLREAGGKEYIRSVWGIGFMLKEESELN